MPDISIILNLQLFYRRRHILYVDGAPHGSPHTPSHHVTLDFAPSWVIEHILAPSVCNARFFRGLLTHERFVSDPAYLARMMDRFAGIMDAHLIARDEHTA